MRRGLTITKPGPLIKVKVVDKEVLKIIKATIEQFVNLAQATLLLETQ